VSVLLPVEFEISTERSRIDVDMVQQLLLGAGEVA